MKLAKLTGWQWTAVIGLVLIVVWVAGQYAADPHDNDWTDPHQPPPMVGPMVATPGGRPCRTFPRSKSYPDSLTSWDECCVGDV